MSALAELNRMPGHLARRFQQISVGLFHAEMIAAGLDLTSVQYAALVALLDRPEIDQATLAGLIAYDRTTIAGVVDRLVQKGLLRRRVSESDRRARVLTITDAGRETVDMAAGAVARAQEKLLAGLEDLEGSELIRLLTKATSAMNDHSRAPFIGTKDPSL